MKHLAAILALALCSCATRPHVYTGPGTARMDASAQHLTETVRKATDTAKKAQAKVGELKASTHKVAITLNETEQKATDLYAIVPAEYKPQVLSLQVALKSAHTDLDALAAGEDAAELLHAQLAKELDEAKLAKEQLARDQAQYVSDAGKLADDATKERNLRMADEKTLSWYRWHWWGSWIVLGLGVVLGAVLWIAKVAGKFAI